jgi:hypothetical protein
MNWHAPCSSKLLVVAMLFSATAGPACILPPPIDEEDPEANRPPSIDPLLPFIDGEPVTLVCSGVSTTFLADLNDPNPRDTLYYRFFIDYFRLDPDDILDVTPTAAPPVANNRPRTARAEISANNAILLERPADVHVIELFVADRAFDDSVVVGPDVGHVVLEGGLTASYRWPVNPIECD